AAVGRVEDDGAAADLQDRVLDHDLRARGSAGVGDIGGVGGVAGLGDVGDVGGVRDVAGVGGVGGVVGLGGIRRVGVEQVRVRLAAPGVRVVHIIGVAGDQAQD